jgi:hypothetical protein
MLYNQPYLLLAGLTYLMLSLCHSLDLTAAKIHGAISLEISVRKCCILRIGILKSESSAIKKAFHINMA